MNIFTQEPALVSGALVAVIALATSFGLHWSVEQVGAVTAAFGAVLALFVRSQVTPVAAAVPPTPPQVLTPPAPKV